MACGRECSIAPGPRPTGTSRISSYHTMRAWRMLTTLFLHGGAPPWHDVISVQLLQESSSFSSLPGQTLKAMLPKLLRRQIWSDASVLGFPGEKDIVLRVFFLSGRQGQRQDLCHQHTWRGLRFEERPHRHQGGAA